MLARRHLGIFLPEMYWSCVSRAWVHWDWVWNSSMSHQASLRPGGEVHTTLLNYSLLQHSVHRFGVALLWFMRKRESWQGKPGRLI